jgi:hypothetical protein
VAILSLVLIIGVTNFAIGFGLAIHLGHGPAWTELLQKLRPALAEKSPAKAAPAAKSKAHH